MTASSGFRRRILIEPGTGQVTAELEDDYHRMVVTLHHGEGFVRRVDSAVKRAPWTSCPGATRQLAETFTGKPLAALARIGEKFENCTHLHDLALFAAAHAGEARPTAYEVSVSDPAAGERTARLARDGREQLVWILAGERFISPPELAGRALGELGGWIAAHDRAEREAVRILRWASILALGRQMEMPSGISATLFPAGTCYTFQEARAAGSTRLPGADRDFSTSGEEPLADRAAAFARCQSPVSAPQ